MGQLKPDKYLLFSYFEYIGDDLDADIEIMGQDKVTQVWWSYTDPLQERLPTCPEGRHWSVLEEIFHLD